MGGIGPLSTLEYYRVFMAAYRARVGGDGYPELLIDSIDLTRMLSLAAAPDSGALVAYLKGELERLARAGAEVGALASNTPHVVFDELRQVSPLPLVSIVEATCEAASARGLKRLGLLGTRFTMQGRFYPEVFARRGLRVLAPDAAEQVYVHDKYMSELVPGVWRPETRDGLLAVVERMIARDAIDGVILGGTELPLLLRDERHQGIPLLDTTRLHVAQILDVLLA